MDATSWATQGVPHDEYHRPAGTPGFEGLVQRVTVFADDACTVVDQIREAFKHRRYSARLLWQRTHASMRAYPRRLVQHDAI